MLVKTLIDRFKEDDNLSIWSDKSQKRYKKSDKEIKIGPITFKPERGDW